jgi:stearoyl-CoA desaturase (delta-9 desaturase)
VADCALFTLVMTHVTMISVTVFLHRHQAHRALDLHPIASHFFRFWLWLTTGQVTKEWAAIHRKHHAKCEQAEDPHSPHVHGIKTVLLQGYELYRAEALTRKPWPVMVTARPTTGWSAICTPGFPRLGVG